jgi:RNA polymerase sigma factor (sigma-70 family)
LVPEQNFEELFLQLLPLIDRVVGRLARTNRLSPQDTEDFAQIVKTKVVEDHYKVLRQYRGESNIDTYATSVVTRAFQDYRNHLWGKFRNSAQAKRLGPDAMLLEQCVVRDQLSFDAACEHLWSRHGVTLTRAELEAIFGQLPLRTRRRIEDDHELPNTPASERADRGLREAERTAAEQQVWAVIDAAIGRWPAEDAAIMAYRFKDGKTVKEIASILGLPEKKLFPRIQALIVRLRKELEAAGLDIALFRELLSEDE